MKEKTLSLLIIIVGFSLAVFGSGGCQGTKIRLQKAESHYEYGLLYLRNGKYNLATIEFQKAMKLNPKDARLYNGLGLTYYFQSKFVSAIQEYQKAIVLNPEYPEVYNNMAAALAKQEKWPEVIRYADKAMAIPSYTTPELAHFNKGVAHYHLMEYEKARTELETSLEFDASYADTHYQLGLTLLKLEQYSQAAKSFQKVLGLLSIPQNSPEDPLLLDAHYHLGLAYFQDNQRGLAIREFQKVVELAPESERAQEARQYLNTLKMK